jgi:hypothetical protein
VRERERDIERVSFSCCGGGVCVCRRSIDSMREGT